ncbi:hypothetical protein BGX26_009186 [Mortierella sp. AD094]|nr:hypothetical protein BGX26_009186 [Mortierella sp. AD094]
MASSTTRLGRGRWRITKTLLLPLLFILLLALVNDGIHVAAQDVDGGNDDGFPDPGEIGDDPSESTIPSPIISPSPVPTLTASATSAATAATAAPSLPETTSVPTTSQPSNPVSTTPSGILKPGTRSPDCAVIADLYKATGPWQFAPDTVNCCNAEYPNSSGIKCNANGQIIYIYLAGQGLSGTLPESLGSLSGLQYLLLYYNNLSGSIPSSLSKLPLLILDLSHNRLSGSLPSSAAGWTNLGTLNLQQNALTGPVPDWVTTLPNLHSLAIGQNFFTTGDPPPKFTFNIEPVINGTANTTAPVPSISPADVVPPTSTFLETFTRLPKLRQLKLDSLGISGEIPLSWQQKMVNLTKLDLSNNSMQGQIPGFINGFTGLKTLLLDRNEFGGPIPSLGSLKSLGAFRATPTMGGGP